MYSSLDFLTKFYKVTIIMTRITPKENLFIIKGLCIAPTVCWHYDVCVVLDGSPLVAEKIYRRDIRCERMHDNGVHRCDEMQGSFKESVQKVYQANKK